ncbi:MAG: response regulator [Phycisphaerae bacterium]|nr:response regulator transcription factor [Tepidisphaeraceae bacterium]
MPTTRIVIADDHDVVRAGIRGVLERQPGFEVVGEATNGRDAVELTRTTHPDVVVLDLSMPDLNGLEATRQIVDQLAGPRVLILSMHSSRQFISEVLKAGASGYLLKNTAVSELTVAVMTVAAGRVYLSPSIADVVVEDYVRHVPSTGRAASDVLSAREREVLQLLAEGKTSKEIAAALLVSVKTIDACRATIMDKLGLRSVAELTKFAVREGLTPLD